jgi:hypothetical protein
MIEKVPPSDWVDGQVCVGWEGGAQRARGGCKCVCMRGIWVGHDWCYHWTGWMATCVESDSTEIKPA